MGTETPRKDGFRETLTEWVIGWKTANLVLDQTNGAICFAPLYQFRSNSPYQPNDVAKCQQRLSHAAPGPDCRCGFNAFARIESARAYLNKHIGIYRHPLPRFHIPTVSIVAENLVIMRVGLSGRVVEGLHFEPLDFGYKAERQRVANVLLPAICSDIACQDPAELLGELTIKPPRWIANGCTYLRPLCTAHARMSDFMLSIDDCARRSQITFAWDTI